MRVLLFSLRGVPEDEAEEVRALLAAHKIDFYETPAGNWGASMPALWLHNEIELVKAQTLLADYQQQRAIVQRNLYLQAKQTGQHKTIWKAFSQNPLLYLICFTAIGLVIYASIRLIFDFGL